MSFRPPSPVRSRSRSRCRSQRPARPSRRRRRRRPRLSRASRPIGRHNVTLLQQEHLLRPGTVTDNIGYGKPGASHGEIVAAAKAAGAHEFISALPAGYDSRVGQHGRLLSGGQRQRIAIARAVLRDAPVIVLDEPTTGLSPADTRQLMELLGPVIAGRTVIVITHDPAVAASADRVITLNSLVPVSAARSADRYGLFR